MPNDITSKKELTFHNAIYGLDSLTVAELAELDFQLDQKNQRLSLRWNQAINEYIFADNLSIEEAAFAKVERLGTILEKSFALKVKVQSRIAKYGGGLKGK